MEQVLGVLLGIAEALILMIAAHRALKKDFNKLRQRRR